MRTRPRSSVRGIRRMLHRALIVGTAALTAAAGLALVAPAAPARAADEIHFTIDGDCTLSRGMAVAVALSRYYGGSQAVSCGAQHGAGNQATPVIMSLTDDVTLTSPLPELFGAPVVIQGHGHTIARAQSAGPFRLFTVTDGGAVNNPGDLTITDAVLKGGKVTGASGTDGADGDPDLLCSVDGGHPSGCSGKNGADGASVYGGAISVDGSTLTLTRVVVTGSTAVGGAGGDGGIGRDGTAGTVTDSGRWGGWGGEGAGGGSAFGAGLYAIRSTVTISDSVFSDNTVTGGDGGAGGDAGDGGDGAPGTDAYCTSLGGAHSGTDGGDSGWGGDGGAGSLGGRAFGAAVYARFGDVRIERTSIVQNTAHAGDAGSRGAAGAAGDVSGGEDIACAGVGAGGTSAAGGAAGTAGDDGHTGAPGIAGDALGAAVFFDGYSDDATTGNALGASRSPSRPSPRRPPSRVGVPATRTGTPIARSTRNPDSPPRTTCRSAMRCGVTTASARRSPVTARCRSWHPPSPTTPRL
ncbi:hypothetical protein [Microbacterium elymi]|uniref:Polymorphic outer membrane protein repeat-containing protein n=1 Tax=Microbacterium elymi TaxID=2909587 RepID=A0ABY5NGX3_9MICO|nr:hypothetical protein [Microbacterium elymi]UUT34412.1 hypothetical protein L2X98_27785 [Microbacterium elymi]